MPGLTGYCDGLLSAGCYCPWCETGFGLNTVRRTFHRPGCPQILTYVTKARPLSAAELDDALSDPVEGERAPAAEHGAVIWDDAARELLDAAHESEDDI